MTRPMVTLSGAAGWLAHCRPRPFTLLLTALSLLGAGLVLARQISYGVGLDWDPVYYISVARNLADGAGFTGFDGHTYSVQPPLYPLLLAAAGLLIIDPYAAAGPVNAAIFGLTIYAAGGYLRQRLQSTLLVVVGCLALAFSIPLTWTASHAYSEPLFSLLTVLALIQTDRFLDTGKSSTLIWLGALTGLSLLTRYMGIALPAAVLVLLIFRSGATLPEKLKSISLYLPLAAAPMALWMLRNLLATGDVSGSRTYLTHSWPDILEGIFTVLHHWIFLNPASPAAQLIPPAALGGGVIILGVAVGYTLIREIRKGGQGIVWRPFYIFGGFVLAYLALYAVAVLLGTTWGGVQARHLRPLWPVLLLVGLFVLDRFLGYIGELRRNAAAASQEKSGAGWPARRILLTIIPLIAIAIISAWLAHSAVLSWQAIKLSNAALPNAPGSGAFSNPRWANSETLQYLRENAVAGPAFSNLQPPVYIYTTGQLQPYRNLVRDLDRMRWQVATAPAGSYVAWLFDRPRNRLYNYQSADLRALPGLEPIAEMSDGVLFLVNPDYAAGSYYRQLGQALESREPAARAEFDLHIHNRQLIYTQSPCDSLAKDIRFSLHLFPVHSGDLPVPERQHGFANRDFTFGVRGVQMEDDCLVVVPLPDYPLAEIETGQGEIWRVRFPVDNTPLYRAAYPSIVAGAPVHRAAFNLYRRDNQLHYVKEQCQPGDTANRFFLHLLPEDVADLPAARQQHGTDNYDFDFAQRGAQFDDKCLATIRLPDYPIAGIRTGQFVIGGERLWETEFAVGN